MRSIAYVFGVTSANTNSSSVITIVATISPTSWKCRTANEVAIVDAADREQQRQEQHHVQVRRGVLDDPDELRRSPVVPPPGGGTRGRGWSGDRGLGRREEPDGHDRQDDDRDRQHVATSSWRPAPRCSAPGGPTSRLARRPPRGRSPAGAGCRGRGGAAARPPDPPGCSAPRPPGAITTSPSIRTPSSSGSSCGKLSTSVGPGSPMYRRCRSSISASSTKLTRQLGGRRSPRPRASLRRARSAPDVEWAGLAVRDRGSPDGHRGWRRRPCSVVVAQALLPEPAVGLDDVLHDPVPHDVLAVQLHERDPVDRLEDLLDDVQPRTRAVGQVDLGRVAVDDCRRTEARAASGTSSSARASCSVPRPG